MTSRFNFARDHLIWKNYALRAHARNFEKMDTYVLLQSIVERSGHQRIANVSCDRSRTLEIGVGGGEHLEFEKKAGLQNYTTVDIEPQFLNLVKKYYPEIRTVQVNGSSLPFPDAHFTTVISANTLEHIATLEDTLAEVQRILVINGDFLILVPRNGGLMVELFKRLVTYPFLRLRGIRHPSLIWHYENANSFLRIRVLLMKYFQVKEEAPVPFSWLPAWISPLHFFHCTNSRSDQRFG